ncbi:phospholipase A2 inhibitor [Anoplophora glabripennis]|uniref:phospholipase A2 inhibitor n=1 Tax=Anoplophora glabripennis TaxID=217634 RepID=UPI000873BE74|nr:phospholipase A2 inhibitor [Anoplophora glabripennis]XP_018570863.1 phospholipase A2 inhibitor [Anoplophora glabripennis]
MKLCISLFLLPLLQIEARVNKCGPSFSEACFCGHQFYEGATMVVVNCTGQGFTDATMLRYLPEDVEMLIFTGNHITSLPLNIFGEDMDLSMLKIIDMSNNGITDIKGRTFHHVANVERLILNHNNISISEDDKNLHPRVFSNFYNLEELHLTNAFADNTDAALAKDLHDIFVNSNLTKLVKLHLEQNEIKNFKDDRVFCDLPNLQHLYLGDNYIPCLNFNVTCLPKLTYLDLEGNNITSFSDSDLDKFDRLIVPSRSENLVIDIDDNPFRCDSAIQNLYNWLHKTKVKVRNLERLECHQAKYGRKYIMNLKNLTETKHAKVSQALTVLLVILVVVLITLLSAYIYLKKESVKERLSPIFDAVSRKVQYTTIESQDV